MNEKNVITVRFVESLEADLQEMHDLIRNRAHKMYIERGSADGNELDDWLNAESELIWSPSVTLSEKDEAFIAEMELWDVKPEELDVKAAGKYILVRSKHSGDADAKGRHVFCGIEFPSEVTRDWTRAEYRNGSLRISMLLGEHKAAARSMTA